MQNFIYSPPEKLAENTIKKYSTTLTHLKKMKTELYFSDIDNEFVVEFYGICRCRVIPRNELRVKGKMPDCPTNVHLADRDKIGDLIRYAIVR